MEQKRSWKRWLWFFSLPAATVILYKLSDDLPQIAHVIGWIIGILAPFIGGFVLAFLLYAPSRALEKLFLRRKARLWQKLARPLAIGIVYLLLLGLLTLAIYLLIPQLKSSLTSLATALPGYADMAQQRLEEFTKPGGLLDRFDLADKLDEVYTALREMIFQFLSTENILTAVRSVISFTTSLVDIIIAVMVSIYMLSGRENLVRECKTLLGLFMKPHRIAVLADYSHRIAGIFYSYLYGSFIDAMVVGIVVSIGLAIFRVPYAVLLGMTMGLLNMIPYFGAMIGSILIILITLLTKNIYAAIGVALYIVIVQQVDGNIVQPRVVGGTVGIRPIYVLLGITLFGGLFGFWGIFLGVPLMATIQMLVKDLIARKRRQQAAEVPAETPAEEKPAVEPPQDAAEYPRRENI